MTAPELRTFELDDGSVYQRIPASVFPDGDTWDSVRAQERADAAAERMGLVVSQNGWPANDRSLIASFTIPGTKTKIALRAGDVSVVILDFLGWWNIAIEPIDGDVLDDWGYAERLIRGSSTAVSNHASGTAGDGNATRHPLGTYTLTKPQLAAIKARIALYRGVLRHGAFYSGRPDEMHVEINAGPDLVRQVADEIRAGHVGGTPTTPPSQEDDMFDPIRDRSVIDRVGWLVDQIKPNTDLLPAENAQTDVLVWAANDIRQTQAATLAMLAALGEAVRQVSSGEYDHAAVERIASTKAAEAVAQSEAELGEHLSQMAELRRQAAEAIAAVPPPTSA